MGHAPQKACTGCDSSLLPISFFNISLALTDLNAYGNYVILCAIFSCTCRNCGSAQKLLWHVSSGQQIDSIRMWNQANFLFFLLLSDTSGVDQLSLQPPLSIRERADKRGFSSEACDVSHRLLSHRGSQCKLPHTRVRGRQLVLGIYTGRQWAPDWPAGGRCSTRPGRSGWPNPTLPVRRCATSNYVSPCRAAGHSRRWHGLDYIPHRVWGLTVH